MIAKYFLSMLISIINLVLINIIIFYKKINGKKIIVFFHSKGNLKRISDYYINPLLSTNQKKVFVLILDNDLGNIFSYHFIKENLLKFLYGVEIFLNNYLCDTFPKNSKRIYIHHDIYDTPLSNSKIEKTIKNRLSKYDYILLPSIKSRKVFDNLKINYKKKGVKIEYVGYYKLDLLNFSSKKKQNTKNVLIAPTNIFSFPSMSLIKSLVEMIDNIILNSEFNVIFRPHPSNLNNKKILDIEKKYKNNPRFTVDKSKNYFNTYVNSKFLITDLSGTAYTYAFLTNNPVIFFSNYEKKLNILGYKNLNFFKDRKKIGFIVNDIKSILRIISHTKTKKSLKVSRDDLKKFFFIGLAKKRFKEFVEKII